MQGPHETDTELTPVPTEREDVFADDWPGHPDGKLLATALARVFRIGTPLLAGPAS